MKNTAKKILALVFAVAMICTLAVPAFAEDEDIVVDVTVVTPTAPAGKYTHVAAEPITVTVKAGKTLHDVLNDAKLDAAIAYSSSKGIDFASSTLKEAMTTAKADGAWVAAVNGKVVSNYKDYIVAEDDEVVIYWADEVVDTKLVMVDYEQVLKGIISFYYYDAEGNRQPVVGMEFSIDGIYNKYAAETNTIGEIAETAAAGAQGVLFVTDEAGQIWIAPEDLVAAEKRANDFVYKNVAIAAAEYNVKKSDDAYDEDDEKYYATFGALNYVTGPATVDSGDVVEANAYDAPNTGDMTMVYVLVAAAAIVTLGAVVVMKKKAVKAN